MLLQAKNIFIVGIKGVAMANLALILKKMGKNVVGSDVPEEFITEPILKKNNIFYFPSFQKKLLPKNIDLVIYSAANHGKDNPQVKEALKRKINVVHQAEALSELMSLFKDRIAICGSHGKTTTAAWLSYALIQLQMKPSYLVGAPSFHKFFGGDFKEKDFFIVEADEYALDPPKDKTPKFYYLRPKRIICTNIDFDHPDVYQNINQVIKAFTHFFDNLPLIINIDNQFSFQCFQSLKTIKKTSYGYSNKADFIIKRVKTIENGSIFDIEGKDFSDQFKISLFGKQNISNAAAVIIQLWQLGFSIKKIKKTIKGFTGAKRRFEKVFFYRNIYLFDDYGHHPEEIKATILAARQRFPNCRIIVIFQPHTYSRTKKFLKQFAQSLSLADLSLILPIFSSARENSINFHVNSLDIQKEAKKIKKNNILALKNINELTKNLKKNLQPTDVIFTMGAGDVYKLKDEIKKIILKII